MLTAENLANLERMFREHMSKDSEIHLEDFKAILNSKNVRCSSEKLLIPPDDSGHLFVDCNLTYTYFHCIGFYEKPSFL
jgi:hypothetical protein